MKEMYLGDTSNKNSSNPMVDFNYSKPTGKNPQKSMFQMLSPKKNPKNIINNNPKEMFHASNHINSILSKNLTSIYHEHKDDIPKDNPLFENVNCLIQKNNDTNKMIYNQMLNLQNNENKENQFISSDMKKPKKRSKKDILSYTLVKDGIRGKDIVLTIDINLQKEIENILTEEIINAKKDLNTSLYDGSKVIITDPNTGEILAFASKEIINNNIYDNSTSLVTEAVTPGSIVKGASISTGYKYGAIDIGEVMLDECIKIKNKPSKCSWRNGIGYINDIEALMISSNSYQFKTAIRVSGEPYLYNKELNIKKDAFDKYRNMFNEYGLGIKTNIDLPVEASGNIGDKYDSDMLLDLVIGQYDTYTPVQIASYISTIATSGSRYKLHFLKEVRNSSNNDSLGDIYLENRPVLLNKVSLEDKYMSRVRLGFSKVMLSLGYGYMGYVNDPSGKTGTSNSFKDTDNDGVIDRETISKAFIGYAPSDNPKFAIVVLSPNVSDLTYGEYVSNVNFRISERVSNKVFDFLK